MRSTLAIRFAFAAALLSACGGSAGKSPVTPVDTTSFRGYRNVVLDQDFPDPSVIKVGTTYWGYATQTFLGNGQRINIQSASSTDLVHWSWAGDVLPVKPSWSTAVWNFWAPHVLYAPEQSRYLMYYSADADTSGMCIGIAASTTPQGAFTDLGSPLVCGNDFWHIDPMAFDDPVSGKHYLYWGSDRKPIAVQELDADRVHFAAGSTPTMVIQTGSTPYESLVEGPWVIKRGDWYYLFYSGNDCCSLPNPHYAVLVARSASPTGPFVKRGDALGTGNSTILTGDDGFRGPGHNAIVSDAAGNDWIVYHAVDANKPTLSDGRSVRRPLLIDQIKYDAAGWPYVEGGHPSHGNATLPAVTP
jgi:arabinan endo-1,5-alpha-L-arabinosidase